MISSIHVVSKSGSLAQVLEALGRMSGVEVHQSDMSSGRAIVTLETQDLEQQESLLHGIRSLDGVVLADLIYLYDADA